MGDAVQNIVAKEFEKRRKAIAHHGGALDIKEDCDEEGCELQIWYKDERGDPYEIVLWVEPEGEVIFECRSRHRKKFGKLLFRKEVNILREAVAEKTTLGVPELRTLLAELVGAFEDSIGCHFTASSDDEVEKQLCDIWNRAFSGDDMRKS